MIQAGLRAETSPENMLTPLNTHTHTYTYEVGDGPLADSFTVSDQAFLLIGNSNERTTGVCYLSKAHRLECMLERG